MINQILELLRDPKVISSFLAGSAFGILLVFLLGRSPGFLVPIFRALGRPFRRLGRWLSRYKLLRRLKIQPRAGRSAAEGATEAERGFGLETEIDRALRLPDMDTDTPHDFREEEGILRRPGRFFKSIRVPPDYLPLHLVGALTPEISVSYANHAKRFFSAQVNLEANDKSLYEDAEGANIISLFVGSDRRCYYALNEFRKTINGNARRLVWYSTLFLYLWLAFASAAFIGLAPQRPQFLHNSNALSPSLQFLVWIFILFLMWLAQNNGYKQQQQLNFKELRLFLNKYLGRIADRYRESTGNAKQVTVGEETDPKKLAESAKNWHKIMVWIPFRTFFIECFIRNTLYQINRNCGYYLWLPTIFLILAGTIVSLVVFPHIGTQLDTIFKDKLLDAAGLLAASFCVVFIYWNRIHSVVIGEELSHLDWLGYDNLDVSVAMDEVVGKYAEDVGFWKRSARRI